MIVGGDCLQLDVGNSGAKWRLVKADGSVAGRGRYQTDDVASREALLGCSQALAQIWVASVADAEKNAALASLLRERWGVEPWFPRSESQTGDLINSYSDPARMGVDRWLAMLAGRARYQGSLCVVDAGSALTIDLVAANGRHEGGYIIPGAQLMERALLLDTDRVRFAEEPDYAITPGHSTAHAVRHGIARAQAGALLLALDRAAAGSSGGVAPQLLFCGGGGEMLQALVARGGVVVPDLVFEGLEVMHSLSQQ